MHPHVRAKSKDTIAELVIKARHDADYDNQDGHSKHDAHNRNEGDDRDKRSFRPQITEGQEQLEWQP